MKVRELAVLLGVEMRGDSEREVTGAAPLEEAGPGQLSFVASRKGQTAAADSRAEALIVPLESSLETNAALLFAPEPRVAFAQCLAALYPRKRKPAGVHPLANVAVDTVLGEGVSIGAHVSIGTGCRIGDGTEIGAGCVIEDGVVIGPGSVVHPRVTIYGGVTIGARTILHSGCVIGADGFGFVLLQGRYEKFPQVGRVEIGDDCEIGANTCIDRAALGVTRLGNGVKLDNMVHIAHNCRIGNHVVIAAQTGLSGGVVVEDYAMIGGQVGIGDKARIESRAVLGSGCGVLTSKIVRGGQVVWGTPARPLKEHLTQLANLSRLPELRDEMRKLQAQVDSLLASREVPS